MRWRGRDFPGWRCSTCSAEGAAELSHTRLQKLADLFRRLLRLALEQAVRRIDFDESGGGRLPPQQTRRRSWDQAVMPGYEAHYVGSIRAQRRS